MQFDTFLFDGYHISLTISEIAYSIHLTYTIINISGLLTEGLNYNFSNTD